MKHHGQHRRYEYSCSSSETIIYACLSVLFILGYGGLLILLSTRHAPTRLRDWTIWIEISVATAVFSVVPTICLYLFFKSIRARLIIDSGQWEYRGVVRTRKFSVSDIMLVDILMPRAVQMLKGTRLLTNGGIYIETPECKFIIHRTLLNRNTGHWLWEDMDVHVSRSMWSMRLSANYDDLTAHYRKIRKTSPWSVRHWKRRRDNQ